MGELFSQIKYDLLIRLRRKGFWFVFLLLNLTQLRPANPGMSAWWNAGKLFVGFTGTATLLIVFLVADSLLLEQKLKAGDFMLVKPIKPWVFVTAKVLAANLLAVILVLPQFGWGPLQLALAKQTPDIQPFLAGFLLIYLPAIQFVVTLSITLSALLDNEKISYPFFIIIWNLYNIFQLIPYVFGFQGFLPYVAFFEKYGQPAMNHGASKGALWSLSVPNAVVNILLLFAMSACLYLILLVHKKRTDSVN